jgi:1,6-anhydro-N-acetylmuramate kinase
MASGLSSAASQVPLDKLQTARSLHAARNFSHNGINWAICQGECVVHQPCPGSAGHTVLLKLPVLLVQSSSAAADTGVATKPTGCLQQMLCKVVIN